MDSEVLHEHIEAYLAGSLDDEARKEFESKLDRDPSLKAEVDRHRDAQLVVAYGLYRQRKERLTELDRQPGIQAPVRKLWIRRLAVAASILLVCAIGMHFYVHHTYASTTLASRMYDPVSDETFRSTNADPASATALMEEAGSLFQQGDYSDARVLYLEVIQGESMLVPKAEWNLLMCYLAEDPSSPQFEVLLLRMLENSSHPYHEDALKLRSAMGGFFYRVAN